MVSSIGLLIVAAASLAQTPCERLKSLSVPNVTITTAEIVSGATGRLANPACRVTAILTPAADSEIAMEIWLPVENWNGKFAMAGNGGWSGNIQYQSKAHTCNSMTTLFMDGYAVASTDRGLRGGPSRLLGHPNRVTDFGYRAVHETAVLSKNIITTFYGHGPKYSYFNGCSSGGQEGLMEAQRYPEDFDGIVAGEPVNNWTHEMAAMIWDAQAVGADQQGRTLLQKLPLLHDAVLQACDALDGVRDGYLEDPRTCKFDPKTLECKGADASNCLTAAEAEAARKIYAGPFNARTHQQIFPGKMFGSELGWSGQAESLDNPSQVIGVTYSQFVTFQNPNWDYRTFDFDRDIALADKVDNGAMNANDPNLAAFFARGGKLIQYHGWSDEAISPLNSLNYFNSVVKLLGVQKVDSSYRLFMIPGMWHGGEAGDPMRLLNPITALERWRELNLAPDHLTAMEVVNGFVESTHLVCPYPRVANYNGAGSTKDAANFSCKVSPRN
jgi:feruloyl esterase